MTATTATATYLATLEEIAYEFTGTRQTATEDTARQLVRALNEAADTPDTHAHMLLFYSAKRIAEAEAMTTGQFGDDLDEIRADWARPALVTMQQYADEYPAQIADNRI